MSNTADKLAFNRNSADKKTGHGVHEIVQNYGDYEELNKIPHWRRVLCSQWSEVPFRYDKYSFRSVDHALQYAKFAILGYIRYRV